MPSRRVAGVEIRVLTYHRFGDDHHAPFTVSAAQFDREMGYLASTGKAVSLADIEAFVAGRKSLADGSVLVTFDDGDPSVRTVAMPILQKHRVPSVAYILAGRPAGFELMTFDEVRQVQDGGITIGSHSISHRSLGGLPRREALAELKDSRRRLEDEMGREIRSFAYPFGTRNDMTPDVVACAEEAGYTLAFSSLHGPVVAGATRREALTLPRVKVESGDPAWLFPALCAGAMDRWRIVDNRLSGMQKPAESQVVSSAAA
ncbi:polysaccharide deacetylase family protein [Aureimonas altamirensis]|nr:polysaccharide deacetylase family protein [Aureimonas altamirensis]